MISFLLPVEEFKFKILCFKTLDFILIQYCVEDKNYDSKAVKEIIKQILKETSGSHTDI